MTENLDDIVIRNMLIANAEADPEEEFLFFEDGSRWTRKQALNEAAMAANALRGLGLAQGDRLSAFLPNGKDILRVWWGAALLGAVLVPVNTAYRGALLRGLLEVANPTLLVTDDELGERVDSCGAGMAWIHVATLTDGSTEVPALDRPIRHSDAELLVTTSGTTGPSKLVATTYLHNFLGGSHFVDRGHGRSERFLIDLPMYHSAMIYMISACLNSGCSMVVRTAPAMSNYWEVARETRATMALMVSTMLPFLVRQPPRAADSGHSLRAICVAPVPAGAREFLDRFGIEEMYTVYGSTEVPGPTYSHAEDEFVPGYCGRARDGFQLRIVDDHDIEVPIGEPGELVIRTDQPWAMMVEYADDPEATVTAWRNGWLHTGDMFRRDEVGRFFFVDRYKDAMRRRGENISSIEVEGIIVQHPSVLEAACVPSRMPDGVEDEVKVWIVPSAADAFDYEALFLYCVDSLPHFMVPRFIELADELPKTPTARVKKAELRSRGDGEGTWDAEAHGLKLTRQGVKRAVSS